MASSRRAWLLGSLIWTGCTGNLGAPQGPGGESPGGSVSEGTSQSDGPSSLGSSEQALGRTGARRLSNVEYDNTVRDLLGTEQRLAATFVAEDAAGFDNVAAGLGVTPSQFESYFNAAETLAGEAFASEAKRKLIASCTPAGNDGGPCLDTFFADFGLRAFRRPLSSDEKTALRAAYSRARALGESELNALKHVVMAMLSSAPFLFRMELAEPASKESATHALDGYALAARLSYFVWSTLPDKELLRVAADGSLREDATLKTQLARMLDDKRAGALVDNFAGQWLGLRALSQHKVLSDSFPDFDDALRNAMIEEARSYFSAFLAEDRPLSDFLRSNLHFYDARLAKHYGVAAPTGTGFMRSDKAIGDRRGYPGLAAFLTLSSFAHRTSPTLRAKWILEQLLCSTVPPPPPNVVTDLDAEDKANAAAAIENVRERLELHRSDPKCAGCHASLDPIGLGLESFDGIGKSRTRYANGDPVDTSGELPGGQSFDGPVALSEVLAADPRFIRCTAEKLLTYALGRAMARELGAVETTLSRAGAKVTLRALIEAVVLSDVFRKEPSSTGGEP
jgi:Protein of unknown function (DUF1592)/Protein of unknown function (DUF1588)/Protein of unknown function (DUF1587)/Protein of unknown function (DUF1595)/Protein of unknown function (DUF1585)